MVIHMAKLSVTVTIDDSVLAYVDQDASAAGVNRSQHVEEVLRRDHWTRYWAGVKKDRAKLSPTAAAQLTEHERLIDDGIRAV